MSVPDAPRVLLPRPAGRGAGLRTLLEEAGCTVEQHPFVELVLEDTPDLRAAARELADGRWTHLVLTSPRAVDALRDAQHPIAAVTDADAAALAPPRSTESASAPRDRLRVGTGTAVWAVGEGTAAALREAGVEPELIATGSGAALVEQAPAPADVTRALLPLSAAAAATVPDGLAARGYTVQQVTAYRPELTDLPAEVIQGLPGGRYAAIALTSSMIADRAAALGVHPSTAIIAIGRPTEETARGHGLPVTLRAAGPSDAELARAVLTALDLPAIAPPGPSPSAPGSAPPTRPAAPSAASASAEEIS